MCEQMPPASEELVHALRKEIEDLKHHRTVDLTAMVHFCYLKALEKGSRYFHHHSMHVRTLSKKIAMAMGFPEKIARMIQMGAELHDIGVIGVHSSIIDRITLPEGDEIGWQLQRLSPSELLAWKEHPSIGSDMLKNLREISDAMKLVYSIVRYHHEKCDGSGYPEGLKDEKVPGEAQIVGLADCFFSLTGSKAPHGPTIEPGRALDIMKKEKHLYNYKIFRAFEGVVTELV